MSDNTESKQATCTGMAGKNELRGGEGSKQMECLKNLVRLWQEEKAPTGGGTRGMGNSQTETDVWYLPASEVRSFETNSKVSALGTRISKSANLSTDASEAESASQVSPREIGGAS